MIALIALMSAAPLTSSISDISVRMVVNKILVHQNEDKTLDIKFVMNGKLGDNSEAEINE